jgi:hypothetical protein
MVLTEVGTNLHALFPPVYLGKVLVDGVFIEQYAQDGIDPWAVRMVSLSLASALMCFLWSWIKLDNEAPTYLRAWAGYYIFQAIQKMAGLNVGPLDWPFDAAIMAAFIGAAFYVNRVGLMLRTNPLRIVWRRP